MSRIIALDSGPAGLACDDPRKAATVGFGEWLSRVLNAGNTLVILPEVADYEVRRKLLALDHGSASIRRLDELVMPGGPLVYVPINTPAMRLAARLWSEARRGGYSTAEPAALDGDVIIAAQALGYVGAHDSLIVATGNESDLMRYVGDRAKPWEEITP